MIQLELFVPRPLDVHIPYWKKRLAEWPCEVWQSRHHPHTTGFSMALQGGKFADWLFKADALTSRQYSRWQRFERRVLALGVRHGCLPSEALENFADNLRTRR